MKNLTAILCLTLAVFLGSAGPSWSADFQKGLKAAKSGDFATALREWEPLAQMGQKRAQHNLGLIYDKGLGVPQNYKIAMKWYRLASKQGEAAAQKRYGELVLHDFVYRSDVRKLKDLAKALKTKCDRNIKCAFNKVWSYLDISRDGRLSLAEIARFQRNVVKFAAADQYKKEVKVEEIAAINLTSIIFLPITASSILHSFDYNNDGLLSKREVFGETEFSNLVGLDVETLTTGMDFRSLGEKLQRSMSQVPFLK